MLANGTKESDVVCGPTSADFSPGVPSATTSAPATEPGGGFLGCETTVTASWLSLLGSKSPPNREVLRLCLQQAPLACPPSLILAARDPLTFPQVSVI